MAAGLDGGAVELENSSGIDSAAAELENSRGTVKTRTICWRDGQATGNCSPGWP